MANEIDIMDILALCDKKCPTIRDMREIKKKVLAIKKEMEDHLETIRYFEKLMKKKRQISN